MRYMLLPFSHTIDAAAIEQAIALAHEHAAILVPLSIILLPEHQNNARLERIEQSQDFLTLVTWKAARAGVPIEKMERYAARTAPIIHEVAQELQKQHTDTAILLFVRQQQGLLLSASTIRQLTQSGSHTCFLSVLPAHRGLLPTLRYSFRMAYDIMVGSLLHFTA